MSYNKHKYFQIFRLWAYQMKVIPEGFERTRWRLFQKALSVPDECYFRRLWAYQMNVISEGFERTRWMLFQKALSVPDECYSKRLWAYQMNVISESRRVPAIWYLRFIYEHRSKLSHIATTKGLHWSFRLH
jgi:hypothetical protein